MKMDNLLYITHTIPGYSHEQQVLDVCRAGVQWVQLRMKQAGDDEIIATGKTVSDICQAFGARFILNDKPHLVQEVHADGVHLGREDMDPGKARELLGHKVIIGCTANTFDDIRSLTLTAVDYIGCGPYRFTTTKEKERLAPVLGVAGYRKIFRQLREYRIHVPVIAIGGIQPADMEKLFQTGVKAIALSSAIYNAPDPVLEAKIIVNQLKQIKDYGTT